MLALTLDRNIWWYTARASGMVAWVLLAASVCWGLAVSGRLSRRVPPPAWNLDLHRFLGGLAVAFTGIHLLALSADQYVHFGWAELFVPLASRWRPVAVSWGITGLYLLLAIEVTSLVMRWLPRRLWRVVHASAFLLFIAATGHALEAGTDAGNPLIRKIALVLAAMAGLLGALRVWGRRRSRSVRPVAARASGAGPVEPPFGAPRAGSVRSRTG